MHGERDFIVAWKGIDDAMHFFQVVGTLGTGKTRVLGHAEVILIVRLVHKSLFANYFPVIIDKDVAHNGIHPTSEIGVGFKFVFVIQSLERCLLQQIIRFFPVGCQLVCKAKQFFLHCKQIFSKTVSIHTLLNF